MSDKDDRTMRPDDDETLRPEEEQRPPRFPAMGKLSLDMKIDERYQILEETAEQGSEADVFMCHDTQSGENVAVKLYRGNFQPNTEVLDELVGIVHEDIVTLKEYGTWSGRFYEVMEWCYGGSLDKCTPFTEDALVGNVLPQIANALAFMRGKGIVHGDLKHSNLFYRDRDRDDVVVGDFGISSLVRGESSFRVDKAWKGTHVFSAPETYFGFTDTHADYYSFGIIIMYLFTSANPFGSMSPQEIMQTKTFGSVNPPRDCSQRLKTLIRGLIVRDRDDRWGPDEVQRWFDGEDVPVAKDQSATNGFRYRLGDGMEAIDARSLGALLNEHPDIGKDHLQQGILIRGIEQFDQALASRLYKIRESADNLDAAYVEIVYTLNPDLPYRLIR